jgi:hypothetical protein
MVLVGFLTAGMKVNISKSKLFAEHKVYMGFWISRQGIQAISKKVEMNNIHSILAPKTRKEEPATSIYWYSQLLSRHVVCGSQQIALDRLTNLISSLTLRLNVKSFTHDLVLLIPFHSIKHV